VVGVVEWSVGVAMEVGVAGWAWLGRWAWLSVVGKLRYVVVMECML